MVGSRLGVVQIRRPVPLEARELPAVEIGRTSLFGQDLPVRIVFRPIDPGAGRVRQHPPAP